MDVIKERLTNAYMRVNESSPGDPSLRQIATLTRRVNEFMSPNLSRHYSGRA